VSTKFYKVPKSAGGIMADGLTLRNQRSYGWENT